MTTLGDRFKELLIGDKRKLYSCSEDKVQADISPEIMEADYMLYYGELYYSVHNNALVFEYKQNRYIVLDNYCANPLCDCTEIVLAFYAVKNNQASEDLIMDLRYNYKTGLYRLGERKKGLSEQDAEGVYQAFVDYYTGDWNKLFRERHRNVKLFMSRHVTDGKTKQLSTKSSSEHTGTKKIGRNEPCPCGSGKKYKRCCGLGK
jgi:uncharacterized protein YchJ